VRSLYVGGVSEDDGLAASRWPLAFVAVELGTSRERIVGIHDILVIGRECGGVHPSRQLILDDETISRRHVEICLVPAEDRAFVFDTSTNGTRLNGHRIERASEVPIRPGDRLTARAGDCRAGTRRSTADPVAAPTTSRPT
jgi:hypothetical protein